MVFFMNEQNDRMFERSKMLLTKIQYTAGCCTLYAQ